MATTPPADQWHKIKNKETGEEQIVCSLGGIDLTIWDVIPIVGNEAPTEFDTVADDGTVQVDQARKDLATQVSQLREKSQDEFLAYVLVLESRIATLEAKVSSNANTNI